MSRTFQCLFVVGFAAALVFIHAEQIHQWMIRKERQWRKELKELKNENEKEEEKEL